MRKGIRYARIAQLVGAAFLVLFAVSCSQALNGMSSTVGAVWLVIGLILIVGAKIYEWLSKE